MTYEKHPSYGYLTKQEYEAMKRAPAGQAKEFMAVAKKREAIAKKSARIITNRAGLRHNEMPSY